MEQARVLRALVHDAGPLLIHISAPPGHGHREARTPQAERLDIGPASTEGRRRPDQHLSRRRVPAPTIAHRQGNGVSARRKPCVGRILQSRRGAVAEAPASLRPVGARVPEPDARAREGPAGLLLTLSVDLERSLRRNAERHPRTTAGGVPALVVGEDPELLSQAAYCCPVVGDRFRVRGDREEPSPLLSSSRGECPSLLDLEARFVVRVVLPDQTHPVAFLNIGEVRGRRRPLAALPQGQVGQCTRSVTAGFPHASTDLEPVAAAASQVLEVDVGATAGSPRWRRPTPPALFFPTWKPCADRIERGGRVGYPTDAHRRRPDGRRGEAGRRRRIQRVRPPERRRPAALGVAGGVVGEHPRLVVVTAWPRRRTTAQRPTTGSAHSRNRHSAPSCLTERDAGEAPPSQARLDSQPRLMLNAHLRCHRSSGKRPPYR